MFWHGRSSTEICSSLSTLATQAPSGSPPAPLPDARGCRSRQERYCDKRVGGLGLEQGIGG
jgi:hypothetical protein